MSFTSSVQSPGGLKLLLNKILYTRLVHALPVSSIFVQWMRARWTSDPCYAFYGVDGSDCSFLVYLSEVEWFCPPLAWRNQSSPPTQYVLPPKAPKRQVSGTYLSESM